MPSVNLFIFISNEYSGKKKLNGVIEDRINLIKAFGWEDSDYTKLFSSNIILAKFKKPTKKKVEFRFCLLTNCSKVELIHNLKILKEKYNYQNVILSISGHGANASGLITFQTQEKNLINLSSIIKALNTSNLLNLTILLDMCRTGSLKSDKSNIRFIENTIDKRVAVMTASWRGETAADTTKGGYLIQALVKTINENFDQFINSMTSFYYMISLVDDIIIDYFSIRLGNIEKWIKIVNSTDPKLNELKIDICKKLTSVYFNLNARKYLSEYPRKLKRMKKLFRYLCKNYDSDIKLTAAAATVKPTSFKIRKKRKED